MSFLNRRQFNQIAAGTALYSTLGAQAQSQRPNVVLILTDDQGYGDLGVHGNKQIHTPHLDQFARQSTQLTNFYVCPVCAPTRACLMTGRYNYRTGVVDTYLGRAMMHSDEVTLAEKLGEAGYQTGIFGKWHLGDNYPLRSMDQGFQESLVHTGGGIGQPSDPPGNRYFDPILQHNGEAKPYNGYCTDIFTDAAIDFIKQNQSGPFFVYLSTNAPHTPLQVDEKYVQPYLDKGLDETTAKVYGLIENLDENVGKLLSYLHEQDLDKNTIVIFMTDNGAQQKRYNANLRGRKGSVYEGGIRVPFYIRWPKRWQAGRKIAQTAAHIDLFPTLLEYCGAVPPQDRVIDGISLKPLLDETGSKWPERPLFFQWHRGDEPELYRASAARGPRYKLVNGVELYDIKNDPYEETDIAAEHPEMVEQLRGEYEAWFRDVSATRGYAPPRIFLGTPHENPVTLTRQDWRGPRAGWANNSLGYWEVDVRATAGYAITLRFDEAEQDGFALLKIHGGLWTKPVIQGEKQTTFDHVSLNQSEARLEAIIVQGRNSYGVNYVDVKKI